ncbi:MAG TPA: hypothetical protein VIK01_09400 [Polyangiaceae bacterium]
MKKKLISGSWLHSNCFEWSPELLFYSDRFEWPPGDRFYGGVSWHALRGGARQQLRGQSTHDLPQVTAIFQTVRLGAQTQENPADLDDLGRVLCGAEART